MDLNEYYFLQIHFFYLYTLTDMELTSVERQNLEVML